MNLTIFSRENYNFTLLNSFEIENPCLALKELLAGSSVQEMKRRTEELMLSAIHPIGWRNLGAPIYLYQTCKKNKMIELTWLNTHNDPGNIVYLKETIESQLDAAWICYQTGFPQLKKRQPNPKYVTQLAADEIIDPKRAVTGIFKQRRLSEWKELLETWLCQSLSNKRHEDTPVTDSDVNEVIRLMQAAHLIYHKL